MHIYNRLIIYFALQRTRKFCEKTLKKNWSRRRNESSPSHSTNENHCGERNAIWWKALLVIRKNGAISLPRLLLHFCRSFFVFPFSFSVTIYITAAIDCTLWQLAWGNDKSTSTLTWWNIKGAWIYGIFFSEWSCYPRDLVGPSFF